MLKYQRVIAEINLDNIAKNMLNVKKSVNNTTKIMAIVKADGYGHGGVEVAKTCLYNGADYLGVAILDEALSLRENNIFEPILILGYTISKKFKEVIENDIIQTVFSYDMAKDLNSVAKSLNKVANIHIKLDTGMSRLGFLPNEVSLEEIKEISKFPFLKIKGIYTHFATSDSKDKSFTREQFNNYLYFVKRLEENGINGFIKHVSNSGAILDLEDLNLDMVRAGIIIYGMYPSNEVRKKLKLYPAMSIKTHVSFVKEVDSNVSVSYSRTFFTNKKTKLATIPVGYADGYARIMSNEAKVIINGEFAKVVGNICMDQFIVDVTHIKNVKAGDVVTLLGKDGDLEITTEDLAILQNTINYEIVCNVGKRIPRIYTKNKEIIKIKNDF